MIGDAPGIVRVGEASAQPVEPGELGLEQSRFAVDLDEVLLRHAPLGGVREPADVLFEVVRECGPALASSSSTTSSRGRLCASASATRNSAGRSMRGSSRRTHSPTTSRPESVSV